MPGGERRKIEPARLRAIIASPAHRATLRARLEEEDRAHQQATGTLTSTLEEEKSDILSRLVETPSESEIERLRRLIMMAKQHVATKEGVPAHMELERDLLQAAGDIHDELGRTTTAQQSTSAELENLRRQVSGHPRKLQEREAEVRKEYAKHIPADKHEAVLRELQELKVNYEGLEEKNTKLLNQRLARILQGVHDRSLSDDQHVELVSLLAEHPKAKPEVFEEHKPTLEEMKKGYMERPEDFTERVARLKETLGIELTKYDKDALEGKAHGPQTGGVERPEEPAEDDEELKLFGIEPDKFERRKETVEIPDELDEWFKEEDKPRPAQAPARTVVKPAPPQTAKGPLPTVTFTAATPEHQDVTIGASGNLQRRLVQNEERQQRMDFLNQKAHHHGLNHEEFTELIRLSGTASVDRPQKLKPLMMKPYSQLTHRERAQLVEHKRSCTIEPNEIETQYYFDSKRTTDALGGMIKTLRDRQYRPHDADIMTLTPSGQNKEESIRLRFKTVDGQLHALIISPTELSDKTKAKLPVSNNKFIVDKKIHSILARVWKEKNLRPNEDHKGLSELLNTIGIEPFR